MGLQAQQRYEKVDQNKPERSNIFPWRESDRYLLRILFWSAAFYQNPRRFYTNPDA